MARPKRLHSPRFDQSHISGGSASKAGRGAGLRILLRWRISSTGCPRIDRAYIEEAGIGFRWSGMESLDYALEQVAELYYSARLISALSIAADYQQVFNPAYNQDRGPVGVFSGRLHAEFSKYVGDGFSCRRTRQRFREWPGTASSRRAHLLTGTSSSTLSFSCASSRGWARYCGIIRASARTEE